MQGIRQELSLLMEIHQLQRRVQKVKKKQRQLLSSRIYPKAVQVQKQILLWESWVHQKSIQKKGNTSMPRVSFHVSNDSLAYF